MLTNIAGEMETQAAGLSPAAVQDTSSSEAAMTPFSDEEQQRVCNAFGHVSLSSLGPFFTLPPPPLTFAARWLGRATTSCPN